MSGFTDNLNDLYLVIQHLESSMGLPASITVSALNPANGTAAQDWTFELNVRDVDLRQYAHTGSAVRAPIFFQVRRKRLTNPNDPNATMRSEFRLRYTVNAGVGSDLVAYPVTLDGQLYYPASVPNETPTAVIKAIGNLLLNADVAAALAKQRFE